MSSKREEERNEKIIRGLMKLPPNRRCINCNSLGPQYVCTNFWTFVCMTCSGIHREFTHRVKSVSMSKFTSQEVDSLQKGGNQRARELYMKTWDPQTHKFPDNSNADKVREFIKNVYENKKYALENSSERPPRDPQGLRNHEDETRRASSYHSYSQSPPYDFQYEERRYGKQAPTLTRKPGSDRGLYEGKLSGFFSPSRFIDRANDESFTNEGSLPRASDCSISSRGDPSRSGVMSPTSVRETGSPITETSRDILSEVPQHHTSLHNPETNYQNNGAVSHPQGNASLDSFGTFDSNTGSFKSVNSLPVVDSKPEPYAEISHDRSSSLPSVMQSSSAGTNNGVDLFGAPFATQNSTSTFPTISNSLGSSSLTVDLFQQYPVSSVSVFTEQQPSHIQQTSSLDLFSAQAKQQSATSSHGKTSDEVMPNNGGWATFDMDQKFVSLGSESSAPATVQSSGVNISGNFNPFSLDQGSAVHEHASSSYTSWHEGLQNAVTVNPPIWNAFEDSTARKPIQNVAKINDQAVQHCASDANTSLGYGVYYEVLNTDAIVRSQGESQPPYSSLSSHVSMAMHDFSIIPVAGVNSLATNHVPSNNPFDMPYDSDMGSGNMSQFWDMSSLQATLPNSQPSVSYVSDINQSWFPHNPIPSYVPGGVIYDHPTGSLGLIAGQTPNAQISNIPAQGPVASVGGNPFA